MPRADWRSIGFCLLAVILFDASAPRTSVAEEAPAKSAHQPAAESKGGNGDHAAGQGAGKPERNPTNSEGQERSQEKSKETGQRSQRFTHRRRAAQFADKGGRWQRAEGHAQILYSRQCTSAPFVGSPAVGTGRSQRDRRSGRSPRQYRSPRRSCCSTRRSQSRRSGRYQRRRERRDRQSVQHSRDQQVRSSGADARRRAAAPRHDQRDRLGATRLRSCADRRAGEILLWNQRHKHPAEALSRELKAPDVRRTRSRLKEAPAFQNRRLPADKARSVFGHGHVQMLGFKSFPGRESHGRAATGAMAAYLFYMFDALHIYSFYISRNKRPILLELAH
jgi:hypothetical protein